MNKKYLLTGLMALLTPMATLADECTELEAQENQCRSNLNEVRSDNQGLRDEYRNLREILNNPYERERQIQQCSESQLDLEWELQDVEDTGRVIARKLSNSTRRNQRLRAELDRTERRLFMQWECVVSDIRYAENGVGFGRSEKEARSHAHANIRRDELFKMEQRLKSARMTPEKRAELEAEIANLRYISQRKARKGLHSYCYKAYRGNSNNLNDKKIAAGP